MSVAQAFHRVESYARTQDGETAMNLKTFGIWSVSLMISMAGTLLIFNTAGAGAASMGD